MFDAVLFDLDGVLVDSEILAVEVELQTLAELGLEYDLGDFKRRFLGMNDAAFRDALDADRRARLGRPLPADFLEVVHARRDAAFQTRLTAVEGAREAIEALKRPRAVATSTSAAFLKRKLDLTGLAPLFGPHAYSADLVARGKPHPDIYLYAAERLGADPAKSLALEDSVNGVRSAVSAGMTVWGFAGGGHMDAEAAARLLQAGAAQVVFHWTEARADFSRW
jgi:HAD superfamily hydrolase (TIGR01509 family)